MQNVVGAGLEVEDVVPERDLCILAGAVGPECLDVNAVLVAVLQIGVEGFWIGPWSFS